MKIYRISLIILLFAISLFACQKGFLDKKPNQALTVPTVLSDFQTLLDDNSDLNVVPYLDLCSSDDIYTTDAGLLSAGALITNSYLWQKDVYQGLTIPDWNKLYQQVFYANVIIEGLDKFKPDASNQAQFNSIKGSAYFIRALAFYNLAQEFTLPYNPSTASALPGIPIRLQADVNLQSKRGNLQQTYDQVVTDLLVAKDLLATQTDYKTRPGKPAALALLARVYQTMQSYDSAEKYATACLQIKNTLIDYNTLTPTGTYPPASEGIT